MRAKRHGGDRRPATRVIPPLMVLVAVALLMSGCGAASRAGRAQPTATATPRPTSAPCDPATQWQPPDDNVALNDLALVSADEGWAVGGMMHAGPTGVIYHLLQGQWQRLPQTFPGAEIQTISMGSPDDGWAVPASFDNQGSDPRVPVLHYHDGRWQAVDIPALDRTVKGPPEVLSDGTISQMNVQMFGPGAGWMFGRTNIPRDLYDPRSQPAGVILRYVDGAWTPIPTPPVAPTTQVFALSAVSADEAWAMGTNYGVADQQTIFAHYARGAWSVAPQTFAGVTQQIVMLSPTDGWAFDWYSGHDLLLHYDGTAWARIPAPPSWIRGFGGAVFQVAPGVRWFGVDVDDGVGIAQYANGQWQKVAWPYPEVVPYRIAAAPSGELWGVGDIGHQWGCPPLQTGFIEQGVFLHSQRGIWTQTVLP